MTTYRALGEGELHLYEEYGDEPASGVGARSPSFDAEVAAGGYRPEWTWIAERDGRVVARAAFWGPAGEAHPWSLDRFDPGTDTDRVEVGAELVRRAYERLAPRGYAAAPHGEGARPDYHLMLPPDWRERPDARADAEDRIEAVRRAGLEFFVERINFRWTPDDGLPARPGRLRFAPAAEDPDATRDVLARICTDSLDAYARRDVERYGLAKAVEVTIEELEQMPNGTGWDRWRLARTPDGDTVGIVLGTRNPNAATIGYLGVVPEYRGHHYSDDLVIEALHVFTEAGETLVRDATDVANAPMAAAFARVGYQVTGRRMVFT
jgi:ribosomal protein S18 acetylase RimI-like enzyme